MEGDTLCQTILRCFFGYLHKCKKKKKSVPIPQIPKTRKGLERSRVSEAKREKLHFIMDYRCCKAFAL